jgi:hypothetical protein
MAFSLVAVRQNVGKAIAAHDFMTQIAGDALGAVTPENHALLQIDHAETRGQALENAPANFPVLKFVHGQTASSY